MTDRGNVYGGGTYQGGSYQGGNYRPGGRHSDDEDEDKRPVDDDQGGTLNVPRAGQQPPSSPPRPPAAHPQAPAYGRPPGQTGQQPAQPPYGARQGQQPPQPPSAARGGAQPPHPAQQPQQPSQQQRPQQPQYQTPRPPEMRPPQPPGPQSQPPGPQGQPPSSPPQYQQPPRPVAPPPATPPQGQPSQQQRPAQPYQPQPSQPPVPTSQQQRPAQPPAAAPVSAAPVSAQPVSGHPVSGSPISGGPISGGPVSGQPYSAQPASAQPYSGMPYSGAAPITGGPISSLPTSAGLFGVSQVSAGPTEGTVYGLPVTDRAVETARDAGKPIEPVKSVSQIPTARALELMTSASPPAGLVIGRDAEQVPVVAPFFRPEETRINLIGGVYLARLLVFRALAIGTRVAVCTTRPQEWNGLGETATGRNDRLAVLHGDQPVTVEASQHSPALYVYDVGERGSQTKPVLGPWRTQLTVLPRLTNYADNLTGEAHMTVLQRLTAEEAQIARSAIRVNQEVLQWLQMLHDDMIAMLRKGQKERYLWCAPTSIESQMFGAPMRTY
ncbi:hypothetical protein GCM10009853_018940 [Glycomyces scopariae]